MGSRAHGVCSLRHAGSLVDAHGLSCPVACGILVPRPGIEPASPALEGGFFTTGPPGKSLPTFKTALPGDFPGGPVVGTSLSSAGGVGSIPGQGAKIPHDSWPKNQNVKQKQYCNKLNKDFKNGPR